MRYNKPPFSIADQLQQLQDRGMVIANPGLATHYLSHLNYYRLGGYWLPFEADHNSHQFQAGTTFEQVLDLYLFDRELRLLVLDAIERIEVSIRTQWAYHFSHRYGSHAHLDDTLFKPKWDHQRNVSLLKREASKSQETFIHHLLNKYDEDLPPIWALVEIMTVGQLSKWIANMRHGRDRNLVAHTYGMDEVNLVSFLHHLSTVRNLCAHHSRLWNREFTFTFKLPKKTPTAILSAINHQNSRKIYNTLVMTAYLIDIACPDNHFRKKMIEVLTKYRIDTAMMGFPVSWKSEAFWSKS